jgi:hypothetical protein
MEVLNISDILAQVYPKSLILISNLQSHCSHSMSYIAKKATTYGTFWRMHPFPKFSPRINEGSSCLLQTTTILAIWYLNTCVSGRFVKAPDARTIFVIYFSIGTDASFFFPQYIKTVDIAKLRMGWNGQVHCKK